MQHHLHHHFSESTEYTKYVIQSSDVISDSRIFVREETSEKVVWYKERFLTDDEIVENIVDNATSRILWTIHRPKRGWYIRLRTPGFSTGVFIPLRSLPTTSPFHADGALTFESRVNSPKRRTLIPSTARPMSMSTSVGVSPPSLSSRGRESSKSSIETDITASSETAVHSYPPTPSPGAGIGVEPPSPATVRAKLSELSLKSKAEAGLDDVSIDSSPGVREFVLAPHSTPHVPQPEKASLVTRALSVFKNNRPSHSLSFTLCPIPTSSGQPLSQTGATPLSQSPSYSPPSADRTSKRLSLARLAELVPPTPPTPPPLLVFHDRTPVWSFGSTTGLLEIDVAMEREMGVDRAFWIAVALAYLEFLTERESYIAASDG